MGCVEDMVEELKGKYGGTIPFRQICSDEGITAAKAELADGINGFYVAVNGHKLIILNSKLKHSERRDFAFHELWHHFRSSGSGASHHDNKRDERRANLFAALCRIPAVRDDDDIDSLCERYGVTRELAKLRIEHEIKRKG